MASADAIVVGLVSNLRTVEPPTKQEFGDLAAPVAWTISVEEYLKGEGPKGLTAGSTADVVVDENGEFRILTGLSATCRYAPVPDTRYLFFLFRAEDGAYTTGGCIGNAADLPDFEGRVDQAIEAVRAVLATQPTIVSLGDTGSGPQASSDAFPWLLAAAGAVGAAMLLAGAALFARRVR